MRRLEWNESFSYADKRRSVLFACGLKAAEFSFSLVNIVAAEARGQESELWLGAQKKTRGQTEKILRVIRRTDLCAIFEDWECDNSCVEIRFQETDREC
jgi:hypothetical protein